ncbi:MAG: DUF2183 domain-containing protein [Proteobacteria bacterium]|nr:MAG: DUF2183 domain-containing protein [Pseudomonadota bacterium]
MPAFAQDSDSETSNNTMKNTEYVTFYPSYGYQDEGLWRIPLRVWVHKHGGWGGKQLSKVAKRVVRNKAGLEELHQDQIEMFRFRFRDFVADSQSFEAIFLRFDQDPDEEVFRLQSADGDKRTNFNGLLFGELTLTFERAEELLTAQQSKNGWLRFTATGKDHQGEGAVRLIKPQGDSVISDIDDTVKITEITEGEAVVMMNTFFKPFQAVPQMKALYQTFDENVALHYVSGGPWQMYRPLADFLFKTAGFPPGSMHMKNVRLHLLEGETYGDFYRLIKLGSVASEQQKIRQISEIFSHFPQRGFTLIGDSGEHDPEVFAHIRNQFPEQVNAIIIRDVVNDATKNPERLQGMKVIQADSAFIDADG